MDLVQAPPCRHCATSNAEIHEKCVTHCILCNEQRGNRPKPCYSLHASPPQWRKFPLQMAPASHTDGAGLALKRHEGSSHYTFWPIIVDCDDPRIAPLRIFAPKRVTRRSTHPPMPVYVQLKCTPGPISCTYTGGEWRQGRIWQVYVHLECCQRPISCTYTGGGREMPNQVGHD